MNNPPNPVTAKPTGYETFQLLYFSKLLNRRICLNERWPLQKTGRVTDLVFRLSDPYPEAVGIYLEHGKGRPTELIPWEKVARIEDQAIFITPTETGHPYPPFEDQKGWILLNEHLMGQTILDTDGRRTEVVNDVHLLFSQGRMILVHVDISFNGFLRKWGLERFARAKDQLISWRYVQPLSVEDRTKDIVTLSVTREQALELPSEDLADALEVLSGDAQQAMFAALAPDKAAEVLGKAEPRAKRQLIAFLTEEKAGRVFARMSVLQIAGLFSDLPHAKATELMRLLPPARAARVTATMSNTEVLAATLMSEKYFMFPPEARAGDVLHSLRNFAGDNQNLSYLFVVTGEEKTLHGVVDLRDLVVAAEQTRLDALMISPVVTADHDCLREDLAALFAKYQFHLLPVVYKQNRLQGVVRYRDIMKGTKFETKAD
jgi:CBS domain-containing protein